MNILHILKARLRRKKPMKRYQLGKEESIGLITQDALDMSPKELTDDMIEEYIDSLCVEVFNRGSVLLDIKSVREFLRQRRAIK